MNKFYLGFVLVMLLLVPQCLCASDDTPRTSCNASSEYKNEIVDPVTHWCYYVQDPKLFPVDDGSTPVFLNLIDYIYVNNNGNLPDKENRGYSTDHPFVCDSLVVPSKVNIKGKDYTIVGISNGSFASTSNIQVKKVYLPETVKYIDDLSFAENKNITELHAPNAILAGYMAFYDCENIKVLDVPKVKYFHDRTFSALYSVDSLYLPELSDAVEEKKGYQAFAGCKNLKSIYAPKLTFLIESEFMNDGNLKRFDFPSVKRYINVSSGGLLDQYPSDSTINYISLPNLETPVEYNTFYPYQSGPKIDTLLLPKVKKFQPYYIHGLKFLDIRSVVADSLISLTPPGILYQDSIKGIICHDTSILYWLNYMQNANYDIFYMSEINKSVNPYYKTYANNAKDYPGFETVGLAYQTEMEDTAFMHIPRVKHLILLKGSTAYNPRAFYTLKNLEDITVKSDNEVFKDHHGVLYSKDDELLYYPLCNETTTDSQGKERPWDLLNYRTTGVGPYALYNYKGTEPNGDYHHEIHISKGETCEIGEHAMDGSSVDHVTFDLDAPLTTVSQYAFANMTQTCFRYLKMPAALTTIEQNAFSGDTQLQALEVYNTALTSVGDNAFAGQTAITSIALPNSVTTIGKEAFKGNTAMTYFTMPKHCTSLGENAFSGCSANLIIKIPETQLTSDNLSAAFASTDAKAKLLVPSDKQSDYAGWSFDDATKTVNIPANRYVSFTRSYPISITDTTGVKWTRFYRAVGIEDKMNDKGQYVIKLKRLYAKDLKLIPANSPILMYFEHIDKDGNKLPDSSTATESFNYSICANTNDLAYSEDSPIKAAPGAIRMDQQETDYDGKDYTNFILNSSDSNTGTYDLVANNPWSEVATRTGEKSYLHFPGDGTDTKAKGFVFSIDNSYDDPFATGINGITNISDATGNSSKVNDDAWYTLSGSRTSKPQHGIYIHNGKKVVVK